MASTEHHHAYELVPDRSRYAHLAHGVSLLTGSRFGVVPDIATGRCEFWHGDHGPGDAAILTRHGRDVMA
jgi:hypothetical protein